jgi:cytochrome c peroxidase
MGWLASEKNQALTQLAQVARLYPEIASSSEPTVTDDEAIQKVASLITAYMRSLEFSKDEQGDFNGSPYDQFLKLNHLPEKPGPGEPSKIYGERLRLQIEGLERDGKLQWISQGPQGERMARHDQAFRFGPAELEGLKIFYSTPPAAPARAHHSIGNCAGCHAPPAFTDFRFHNTGASQEEYDFTHGQGSFLSLVIPEAADRARLTREELAPFAQIPDPSDPKKADLGAWNQVPLFPNGPDLGHLFGQLFETLCNFIPTCTLSQWRVYENEVLRASVGAFKTPTLRNLGHSNPYLHTGNRARIEQAIQMYIPIGLMARQRRLRNADPEMAGVIINARDIAPLSDFMRSLNEDYE